MQATPGPDEIQRLISLFRDGRMTELEPLAKEFSYQYPWHGLGWMLLGAIYKAGKRYPDALSAQLKAIEVMPPKAELYSNLGAIQFALDNLSDAERSYRICLQLDAKNINGLFNYGLLLLKADRPHEAEAYLRQALNLDSHSAEIAYQTAVSVLDQKQYSQAVELLQRALNIRPNYPEAHDSLSYAYLNLGQLEKAIQAGYAARKLAPADAEILGNLLFTLNYANDRSTESIDLARAYGKLVSDKASAHRFSAWDISIRSEKLRIGLVSGDFKNHPVTYFLLNFLRHTNKTKLEFFAYSSIGFEDDYTQKIKAAVRSWTLLPSGDDLAAARQIHADGIHVLIDLSGHTGHGRLPIFSFKPAPIQASWLGYFSTTGLPEIDYVLVDKISLPEPDATQFTEAIWYLPETRLCFTAPEMAPGVGPSPSLENEYITFGCYQNLSKVNDDVLDSWKIILSALPEAKLRWQCAQFTDAEARKLILARFRQHGMPVARIQLLKGESRQAYLDSYRHVDIVLDTFPFPGGTTTCEALWMGVPTVTLAGHSFLSRQGASILTAAGMSNWVASDISEYQKKAIEFASDPVALSCLRTQLRPKIEKTPLFDGAMFARNFEATMWQIWARNSPFHD
jgi:predicted O-linked N-acetylglucosamine transferase (SPINDLY family)